MVVDEERLQRLFGSPALGNLRRRLRARYERGESTNEFTLAGLSTAERRALAGLLGRPTGTAKSMRLRLSELDQALARASLAGTLREALESLDGAIRDHRADRASREEAWALLPARVTHPRLRALLGDATGLGLLKRFAVSDAARAAALLEQVQQVLSRLPQRGMPLARLAAEALGDSHALDAGQPAATLVLRACADCEVLDTNARSRDQWARVGISVNELAAPALCLNLSSLGDTPGAQWVRVAATAGEPVHLSLRTLLRQPPAWNVADRTVFVCENPSIVAIAADRLGPACAALVCTDGMPSAAQRTLLTQLALHGARLRYHGDFDWPGLRIGNFLMREFKAAAWRFDAVDYEAACSGIGRPLSSDERIDAHWDSRLSGAMSAHGWAVHEEAVAEALLEDLGRR